MSDPRSEANVDVREEPLSDGDEVVVEGADAPAAEVEGDVEAEEVAAEADEPAGEDQGIVADGEDAPEEEEEEAGIAAEADGEPAPDGGDATAAEAVPAGTEEETDLSAPLEAILFSSELPLSAQRLASWLKVGPRRVLETIDALNVFYGETGRAFRISPLAGGFQLVTTPDHAALLGKLHRERVPTRLSRAALETLSIIAFKQPVTRGEIDAIRGVSASDRVLRHLIERKLVRISGRAEAPGRPLLYGTTREFLGYFGLSAVSDLPRTDELEALLAGDVPQDAIDAEETTEDAIATAAGTPAEGPESGGDHSEVAMMDDRRSDEEPEEEDAPVAAEGDEEERAPEEADEEIEAGHEDEGDDLDEDREDDLDDDLDEDVDDEDLDDEAFEDDFDEDDEDDDDPSDDDDLSDDDFDDDTEDELAEELAEDSAAEERKSHSGEESDEHEGIPSSQ